jgi:transcriptional regulator with XRE-family HTH domain
MSFEDISARLKARKSQQGTPEDSGKTYDFSESYRLRGKMLGVLLRDARLGAARTVEDCARLLRVAPSTIESWEYGDSVPSLPQLELLAYYLDVPISHFWGTETLKTSHSKKLDIQNEYMSLRDRMIGALLRQAREEAKLSLEDVAGSSGLTVHQLQRYELGEESVPMHELAVLSGLVKRNLSYFLESNNQIGELLAMREAWKHFANLPEEMRAFASDPKNVGFIDIALMFSRMPTERLRQIGASILDITM